MPDDEMTEGLVEDEERELAVAEAEADAGPEEERPRRRHSDGRFQRVLLTASRGQHPDSGSRAKGYMGRDDDVDAHLVVHRRSDGTVKVSHHDAPVQDGQLVALVLGQFEPGYPNYRAFSDAERQALDAALEDLCEAGDLADGYEVVGEYGLPSYSQG